VSIIDGQNEPHSRGGLRVSNLTQFRVRISEEKLENEIMPYHEPNTDVDIYDLYKTHARLHDDGKVKMRGTFRPVHLPLHTYDHIFLPDEDGDLTHVVPVFDGCRVENISE
jgi:hypothetical protein